MFFCFLLQFYFHLLCLIPPPILSPLHSLPIHLSVGAFGSYATFLVTMSLFTPSLPYLFPAHTTMHLHLHAHIE